MRKSRVAVMSAGLVVVAGTAVYASTSADAAPSSGVVISEVYGGGGNSNATYNSDFIELTNRSGSPVAIDGWSVQYSSAAGTSWSGSTTLTGTIAAGASYLIGEASGTTGAPLPATNATGTINMAASTGGTVALVDNATKLTCTTASACDAATVDLVGYGTAAIADKAAAPAPADNTQSVQRTSATDSDDNATDFVTGTPTPTGTPTAGGGSTEPGPLRIHDIQGSTWISQQDGKTVTNVPGIVTELRTGSSKGFFLQDPTPDADPATSEGIFVFTSTAPTVKVGDSVLVSGGVQDFYKLGSGETVSTTSSLSVTEISKPTVTVLSSGNALPPAETITPTTVPDAYAPDLGGKNIENTTITPTRSALDFWESREGMRVVLDSPRVVGPSNDFGETYVTSKPTQDTTFRGGTEALAENAIPSGRVEVVTADGSNPGASVGQYLSGAVTGAVDWSNFGGYTIVAPTAPAVSGTVPVPTVATGQSRSQLSVATYNVENLTPQDPAEKYQALANGIVKNLAAPDVIAIEEIQDNDGATDDGVVAADQTLTKLTAAVSAAGGPTYAYREIDPADDSDGGQPGGNIRVAFLFNPVRVSFVDRGSKSVNRSTTGTQVTGNILTGPQLSLSPGRIDPTNPVWTSSRKPLVGQFRFQGRTVFVIGNHFDAKLGDQNADGRFQYPAQSSAIQRAGQAQVEHDFIASILAKNPRADVVTVGDLNDYQYSPALAALRTGSSDGTGTPILTDLISTLPKNQQYTYVFNGVSQVLDHILITRGWRDEKYQVVHVNSEYTDQTSDHDPQVVHLTP